MFRLYQLISFLVLVVSANAFTTPFGVSNSNSVRPLTKRFDTEMDSEPAVNEKPVERGVSVDQDGKSNVWAIEPKMEVSTKSGEEKTKSAILAGVALTNLPDPNQF